jgi:hypothetical protein
VDWRGKCGYDYGQEARSGEVQPAIFAAEVQQRIPTRIESRANHATNEDDMIATLVYRVPLALERTK